MNENINLVEILKDCPSGTKLYSPMVGEVEFIEIIDDNNWPIRVFFESIGHIIFNKKGQYFASGECMLFPSKDVRTWGNFQTKKLKFDPKTLQPFDKILVRDSEDDKWKASFFSHINNNRDIITTSVPWNYNIPFNNDTKYLIGTKDNPPKYYRYWEN